MKALFPRFCRRLAYTFIGLVLVSPFIAWFLGLITDDNLLVTKISIKLFLMIGAVVLFFAKRNGEDEQVEKYRSRSVQYGLFTTLIYFTVEMFYYVMVQDVSYVDSSSFLTFLIFINIFFEYFTIMRK